jgi:hypothetical protein
MARTLFVCALPLLLLPAARAGEDAPKTKTVIRLTVRPMPAPKPALKYQLLPELSELNPGNPIQAYMKCFAEQYNFYRTREAIADREKYQTIPLKDLPAKDLLNYGGASLRQADYAARLDTPDWQILLQARKEGIGLLLPDIQQLRELAAALKVRFRAQVAERRFDDAVRTAKTMLALSRHLGEHPTLIGELVGMAIAQVALGPVEEMIQQPGCPNLYWALTDLPTPLISLRTGLQGERMLTAVELDRIVSTTRASEPDLERLRKLLGLESVGDGARRADKDDVKARLRKRAEDKDFLDSARKRLVEWGLPEGRVKKFPALQVIVLDERRDFDVRRDETFKWMGLPYWQAEAELLRAEAARTKGKNLFDVFLPAVIKVRRAQDRVNQRIALLRHVEAIRLYAAEHDGKVPAKLADVKLPLPVDPFTGKPFLYKVEGSTAIIKGSPPKGETKNAAYNVQYEVTIKK